MALNNEMKKSIVYLAIVSVLSAAVGASASLVVVNARERKYKQALFRDGATQPQRYKRASRARQARDPKFRQAEAEKMKAAMLNKVTKELGLDSGQQERIKEVIEETRQEIKELRGRMRPDLESVIAKSHERIKEFLTPGQQEKFDELIAQKKQQRRFKQKL